jgi:hypothetical protein
MICQFQPMELTEPDTESVTKMSYMYGDIAKEQGDPYWREKFETIIAQKESDVNARLIQDTGKSMDWSSNLDMAFIIHESYYPNIYLTKAASLADIFEEQKARKRQHPHVAVFTQPTYKDDPKLFVAKPGELVKLNCPDTDLTPITMDVVIITPEKLTKRNGWLLSKVVILGERHIRHIDLNVQFKEDGRVYLWDKKQTVGEWSLRKENGFALWQQPSNWSMICQRAVNHRLHIKLFKNKKLFEGEGEGDREIDMIMLFDKTKNLHYLQQDSSFFQMIDGIMMADTSRNPAWSAQPNIYR